MTVTVLVVSLLPTSDPLLLLHYTTLFPFQLPVMARACARLNKLNEHCQGLLGFLISKLAESSEQCPRVGLNACKCPLSRKYAWAKQVPFSEGTDSDCKSECPAREKDSQLLSDSGLQLSVGEQGSRA